MALTISTTARNSAADAVTTLLDGGTIELYTGTKPASPQDAATGTLLATFTLPADSFAAAATGQASLNGTPISATASAGGTAGWFRVKASGGTAHVDGTAGASGTDLTLNTATITSGGTVQITSGSITMPA